MILGPLRPWALEVKAREAADATSWTIVLPTLCTSRDAARQEDSLSSLKLKAHERAADATGLASAADTLQASGPMPLN